MIIGKRDKQRVAEMEAEIQLLKREVDSCKSLNSVWESRIMEYEQERSYLIDRAHDVKVSGKSVRDTRRHEVLMSLLGNGPNITGVDAIHIRDFVNTLVPEDTK